MNEKITFCEHCRDDVFYTEKEELYPENHE